MKSALISKNAGRSSPRREADAKDLRIGGFEPFSTVDYPGRLAAIVFCQGCPLRCGYCHNQDLIPARTEGLLSFEKVFSAIEARKGFLDAVVFSGGEPLAQKAIVPAMAAVRQKGLAVGLHTAGTSPKLFEAALPFASWVGFDIKAAFDRYQEVTGVDSGASAHRSLELLIASGIAHEVRTTVWPERLGKAEILQIVFALRQVGVRRYVLQEARTPNRKPWPGGEVLDDAAFISEIGAMFKEFEIRRAAD
jgi:pyruvate formate lyase activating enzyme